MMRWCGIPHADNQPGKHLQSLMVRMNGRHTIHSAPNRTNHAAEPQDTRETGRGSHWARFAKTN
jgi:hypothetical protein